MKAIISCKPPSIPGNTWLNISSRPLITQSASTLTNFVNWHFSCCRGFLKYMSQPAWQTSDMLVECKRLPQFDGFKASPTELQKSSAEPTCKQTKSLTIGNYYKQHTERHCLATSQRSFERRRVVEYMYSIHTCKVSKSVFELLQPWLPIVLDKRLNLVIYFLSNLSNYICHVA